MSRNKKESYKVHHLLDQDCRDYMESAIKEYHNIGRDILSHYNFLLFWYNRLQKKPTPQNAMLCAFRFNEKLSQKEQIVAEKYFNKIIAYYNHLPSCDTNKPDGFSKEEWENSPTMKKYKEGKGISQWIKSYKSSEPFDYIITSNIDWTPKIKNNEWTKQEKIIAQQCSFSWSIARLWQLLCSRNKQEYMNNFLVFEAGNSVSLAKTITAESLENELTKLKESLKNLNPEDISFFEKNLYLFDPLYLTNTELCAFWKKACISSINRKPLTGTIRQPLDKIWLLARFFGVHLYDIDFIGKGRGLSPRLVKQIVTLVNPGSLLKVCQQNALNLYKKQNPRWGDKGLPAEEIFLTITNEKNLERLRKKAEVKFSDFQNNPEQKFIEEVEKNKTNSSFLNLFDLSENSNDSPQKKQAKKKFLKKIQEDKKTAIKVFLYLAMFDFFYTELSKVDCSYDDSDDIDVEEIENTESAKKRDVANCNEIQNENPGAVFHFISASITWSLKHEKNCFLISNDNFDESFWKELGVFIHITLLTITIIKLSQSFTKDSSNL